MKRAKIKRESLMAMYVGEEVENIKWHQGVKGLYTTIAGYQYYMGRRIPKDYKGFVEIKDKFINEHGWRLWERKV